MWRKFHQLTPVQVFVVACFSAAALALPYALATISNDDTAIFRDFLWPHELNPLIGFGAALVGIIPIFLAYYHLGRVGALVSTVICAVTWYTAILFAIFVFQMHDQIFGIVAYAAVCFFYCVLLLLSHLRAAKARWIISAQLSLGLSQRSPIS